MTTTTTIIISINKINDKNTKYINNKEGNNNKGRGGWEKLLKKNSKTDQDTQTLCTVKTTTTCN